VQSLIPLLTTAFGVIILREGLRGSQWFALAGVITGRVKPRCKGEISLVRYRDFYDGNFLFAFLAG
jgi:hypothetical protein